MQKLANRLRRVCARARHINAHSRIGKKHRRLGKISDFNIGLWHIGASRPTIAVDPRDLQTCRFRTLHVVHIAVADVQHFMRLKTKIFYYLFVI